MQNAVKHLDGYDPIDWNMYFIGSVDVKRKTSPLLIIALSIVLGSVFGTVFALFQSAIRKNRFKQD